MTDPELTSIIDRIFQASKVAVFTGAGISTLCGIPDFRGPQGLYRQADAERIFDIDWFRRDPSIYYRGCRELVYGLKNYQPGPVHRAVAGLERAGKVKGVITQNIDMLHQKAGSTHVYEVHGSPLLHRCIKCGDVKSFEEICGLLEHGEVARCERCGGAYKPDITFFGEMLPEAAFQAAEALAREADLMLVLGTSLTVQPACLLPQQALYAGHEVIIVNGQPTSLDRLAVATYPDLLRFAEGVLAALQERGVRI